MICMLQGDYRLESAHDCHPTHSLRSSHRLDVRGDSRVCVLVGGRLDGPGKRVDVGSQAQGEAP